MESVLQNNSHVMLVLDASGSMADAWTQDASKFDIARQAIAEATGSPLEIARSGIVTFGHRRNFDCSDIEVLSNPTASPDTLSRALSNESPQERGMRPLADAIETAAARLTQQEGPGAIIVLTDGAEECGGNSCALSAPLAQMQIPVHLIGLGMDAADAALLRCLPASAGGTFTVAQPGEDLTPLLAKALSLSHTTNAQRSAASIARLLLQEQDISVRDLTRIRSDLIRLDDALTALDQRVIAFEGRDLLAEELQDDTGPSLDQDVTMIRAAANRLKDQLGSRDQMLIRMQNQTDAWTAGTLGLSRRAALATAMAALSPVAEEPAAKLREGHERLVERRATLETEMAATAAQSTALHGRMEGLQHALDQVEHRLQSTRQLAHSLEAGQPMPDESEAQALNESEQKVLTVIRHRDTLIADLQSERDSLLAELKTVRADLMVAQEDIVTVQRQRATAEHRVIEARDLLAALQANQLAMKTRWKSAIDKAEMEHLTIQQDLEARLASVLARSESLSTDLSQTRQALETTQAENLTLVVARNEAISEAAAAKLEASRLVTRNNGLSQSLSECRLSQSGLNQHIAGLEAELLAVPAAPALAPAAATAPVEPVAPVAPDTVTFVLAPGVSLEDGAGLGWSVADADTGLQLAQGQGVDLTLPAAAGVYQVIADLDGQLVERRLTVRHREPTSHVFSLDLSLLDLRLNPMKSTETATEPVIVQLSSPVYAVETTVQAGSTTRLYLPPASYSLQSAMGLASWQDEMTVAAGESLRKTIDIMTLPVALDLVTGDAGEALAEDVTWRLSDALQPDHRLDFQGSKADLQLQPGVYDVEVDFQGFVATQTIFIDADHRVEAPVHETVRFNDGAVRLRFSNNSEAVPEGLDLHWRIELQGAAIVTSQTLEGDLVQLPAGGYRLRAQANDVELERDFLVVAGQVTELTPDFSLGQVTLSLLDDGGAGVDDMEVEWSVIPQGQSQTDHGFQGAVRTGGAVQTLLLPQGRYRVTAQSEAHRVNRLITVKPGDKAAFGLKLPSPALSPLGPVPTTETEDLAQLGTNR